MKKPPNNTANTTTDIHPMGPFAFVIPVFNHADKVGDVIRGALTLNFPVIVVDDGSTDSTVDRVKNIPDITLLQHSCNRGKGAALLTGMMQAAKSARWAISVDADGQHAPGDALNLIRAIPAGQRPIVVGTRQGMEASEVNWTSRYGRKFSNFWVRVSGGCRVDDSQSGFRIYPLPESLNLNVKSRRYQFEVEVLVKAAWKKIPLVQAPVSVTYLPGSRRISHFH
jgi:glycosyltransferase involved in cell wall biosynthesis